MKHKISWSYMMLLVCILTVYVIPDYYLDSRRIPLSSLLLGGFLMISLIMYFKDGGRLRVFDLVYLALIAYCIVYQRSISPLVLLTPLMAVKCLNEKSEANIKRILLHSKLPYLALAFTLVYSLLYGVSTGRFMHTGVYEVNSSGLAVFLLGLIFMKRHKLFGRLVLLFGCLSLSRNYILALAIYFVMNVRKNGFFKRHFNSRLFDFRFLMISTSIVLYVLGAICCYQYSRGMVIYETTFWGRLTNFFDISNYLRFTTNYFLIEVFNQNPILWLVGCKVNEFKRLCLLYANQHGQFYKGNNPHNFLFSYIKLYGLAGVLDVLYVGHIFKKFLCKENLGIYLAVCTYCIFLSVGANGCWLLLTLSVMILYMKDDDKEVEEESKEKEEEEYAA